MTATLKLRDEDGNIYEIPALVGKKGDKGDTGEQGEQGIQGPKGEQRRYWRTEGPLQGIQGEGKVILCIY